MRSGAINGAAVNYIEVNGGHFPVEATAEALIGVDAVSQARRLLLPTLRSGIAMFASADVVRRTRLRGTATIHVVGEAFSPRRQSLNAEADVTIAANAVPTRRTYAAGTSAIDILARLGLVFRHLRAARQTLVVDPDHRTIIYPADERAITVTTVCGGQELLVRPEARST